MPELWVSAPARAHAVKVLVASPGRWIAVCDCAAPVAREAGLKSLFGFVTARPCSRCRGCAFELRVLLRTRLGARGSGQGDGWNGGGRWRWLLLVLGGVDDGSQRWVGPEHGLRQALHLTVRKSRDLRGSQRRYVLAWRGARLSELVLQELTGERGVVVNRHMSPLERVSSPETS